MSQQKQPNILLILTDQHRLSAVGAYGDTPCQTPNIDRLAEDGYRFQTAYTSCPVCSPTRGTIMTGLYPHAHGICSNVHNLGCSVHELADRPGLLSRRLEAAGYRCGYSGKWHLGTDRQEAWHAPNNPSLPKDVGFEGQNFPGHGGGGFHYPEYRGYLRENGWKHEVAPPDKDSVALSHCGILQGPIESTVPYFLAENTISMIDRFSGDGDSFFIWHNFWGPHGPYYSTAEFYGLYEDVEIPPWPNYEWPAGKINRPHRVKLHADSEKLEWENWAETIRYYYAFTSLIDSQIGRMLDHLEETGLMDDTIVVFTADHGETLGSHGGLIDKGWHRFEEIQRIPLIVWLPEKYREEGFSAPRIVQKWASAVDIYPTIIDISGGEQNPEENHGRSLMPVLCGENSEWRDAAFVEFNGVNSLATSMASVREGNLKYGWNCSNQDELYDLGNDPYEMENLIDDPAYADSLRFLRQKMAKWMEETNYPGIPRNIFESNKLG
ncbi:MAG: sulfatase-like hydrolase/transferase [Candidatus Brocadiia bacterium]